MLFWRPLTNDSSHRRFSEIFAFRWRHVPCCFVADSLQHAATSTAATNNGTAPIALPSEPVKPQLPTSNARNAREYKVDAAKHLYKLNGARIFKGRMPPMLYAVGVLDVEVDKQGQVTRTYWVRAPSHAPEVMREIEKTVRQAAPYPVPAHLGKVVYSDVWLWHKSGHFQLDTLTEGQD
jgi:hypothetical protein